MECSLGPFRLSIAEDFGPRIVGLRFEDGPNLFAELGDVSLDHPEGPYVFGGGHRLWIGPEVPEVTYWPDAGPIQVEDGRDLAITGPPVGPVHKQLTVQRAGDDLVVTHAVRNATARRLPVALWPITQLPPGGVALLPCGDESNGLQADRSLILWPYTDPGDPGVGYSNATAMISGERRAPIKMGAPLEGRPLAYLLDGWVFLKVIAASVVTSVDRGATGQVYVNHQFVELETLGPLVELGPGESAEHVELWRVFTTDHSPADLAARLGDHRWPR